MVVVVVRVCAAGDVPVSCCPAEFLEGFDATFASEVERRQQLEGAIVQEMAAISQVGDACTHTATPECITPLCT